MTISKLKKEIIDCHCFCAQPRNRTFPRWVDGGAELLAFLPHYSPFPLSLMEVALSSSDLFMYVCSLKGVRWWGCSWRTHRTCSQRTGSGVLCFCINWKRQTLELLQGEKRPPARALYTLHLKSLHSTEYLAHSDPKNLLASLNSLLRPSAPKEGGGGRR